MMCLVVVACQQAAFSIGFDLDHRKTKIDDIRYLASK